MMTEINRSLFEFKVSVVTISFTSPLTWLCFLQHPTHHKSRDSSVGVALGYGLDDRGSMVRFPALAGNFSLRHRLQNDSLPTQPPIQWIPGALSQGVQRPGCEADLSPPSNAEIKE
jgi:hypothetical protein